MPYLIACLISALLAGGGVWKYQAHKYELALANLSTTYLQRDFRALETSNAETIRLQNQKDEALRTAAQRQRFWQGQNRALERDLDGLRGDLASNAAARKVMPGDTCSTGADYTSTLETVLGNCTDELGRMAGQAQGHASDTQTLIEAWPKPANQSEPTPPAEPEPSQ